MEHINHLPFIVGSYAAALAVIAGLVAWVSLDYRAQKRALVALELQGLSRRSATPRTDRLVEQAKEQV